MKLEPNTSLHGFEIKTREELPEIDGEAYLGVHTASGARLLYLKNDDNNKSFAIGFKTPPQDDTGVFHILEHSVLCGSQRFPVKEPFVDLIKSSMQTFLNAMTFADKTLYPVASTNEQDLFNLMDVYLDAVFHPQIYQKREVFEQEGWHLELTANDSALTPQASQTSAAEANPAKLRAEETTLSYNGVVYNEMKGALSSAPSVLYDELQKALLPDTCYAFESGGTPKAIPTLTYENFLAEHARHYRTDNSYIILYGNLDIERALAFLDERYLAPVAREQADEDERRAKAGLEPLRPRTITMQAPLNAGFTQLTMDTPAENACAACGYVIGDASQRLRATAVEIILDALLGSNEAPLKRALLDEGVAHDIQATVSDALLQPFAYLEFSMPEPNRASQFGALVAHHVRRIIDEGLDKSLLEASLSHAEFIMREMDTRTADGVVYASASLSSWLYDDDAALDYLRYQRVYEELRANLETDYFETLCLELFCENDHMAIVEIVPTPGVSDDDTSVLLAKRNAELSYEERQRIVDNTALLRKHQETPDSAEATSTLPKLSIADIDDAQPEPPFALDPDAPFTCVRHTVPTHGIVYAYRFFDLTRVAFEDLPYVAVLGLVLGKLDTAHHSAAQLDTLVQSKLGNLSFFTDVYDHSYDVDSFTPLFAVGSSALEANVEYLAQISREVLCETDFSNTGKILDLLKQRKIMFEQVFINSGHACAQARVRSYFTKSGIVREQLGNVGFYQFLCDLLDNFDDAADGLSAKLSQLSEQLFCDDICTFCLAGPSDAIADYWAAHPECNRTSTGGPVLEVPQPQKKNEAFIVPADVCFAALGWDRRLLEKPHDGACLVAARALSYDYLWNEVRVKGGAYGVGFQAMRQGSMRFYSYRDPHLDQTLTRFRQTPEWLASFQPKPEELEGFIVATIASLDAPIKPRMLTRRQAADYFMAHTPDDRIATRKRVIATDLAALRALAPTLQAVIDQDAVCVFGNKEIIESASEALSVQTLIRTND